MPASRRRRRIRQSAENRPYLVVFSQVIVACFIFALIFSMVHLPLNWSAPALRWVKAGLSWEFDLVDGVRELVMGGSLQPDWERWRTLWGDQNLPSAGSLIWPAGGPVVAAFGWKNVDAGGQVLSDGIEISAPIGSPVRAAYAGMVTAVRMSPSYGMVIEVDHGNRLVTLYGRCDEALVAPRQRINQGQLLAQVARPEEGRSQLYFEVRLSGQAVDPLYWLEDETSAW